MTDRLLKFIRHWLRIVGDANGRGTSLYQRLERAEEYLESRQTR